MDGDPMVFKLPCMGGTITVTVSGSMVTVHGAHRVVAEMPIVIDDGRPRFAADSLDIEKSHNTYIINTCLDADGLHVNAGWRANNDSPNSYDSPYLSVSCGDATMIVSAMRPGSDVGQPGTDKTVLQKISFKPQPH
jgi:hypothetical protein